MATKIKSHVTRRGWLEERAAEPDGEQAPEPDTSDACSAELLRVLSELLVSKNLIVLAGLGTSLCVKDGQNGKAPTMQALWEAVHEEYLALGLADGPSWDEVLEISRHPEQSSDIEELLSRCKMSQSFVEGNELIKIRKFVEEAEKIIREKVDFLEVDEALPVHESFLRRLARRSRRRERLRIFTTNYDRCIEHAAQRAGFLVIDGFTFTQPLFLIPCFIRMILCAEERIRIHLTSLRTFSISIRCMVQLIGSSTKIVREQ